MPDITCPECGQLAHHEVIERSHEEFCTQCDYPLFWAPSAVPLAAEGSSNAATLRRLPGAGGRRRIGNKVCPECGELNPMAQVLCLRCNADLDPKPPPPEPPVAVYVEPPPLPPPEPARQSWYWWVLLAVMLALIFVVFVVVRWY